MVWDLLYMKVNFGATFVPMVLVMKQNLMFVHILIYRLICSIFMYIFRFEFDDRKTVMLFPLEIYKNE